GLRLRAYGFIDANGRLVPVEHAPLHAPAAFPYGDPGNGMQQALARAQATVFRRAIQIFQIDAVMAQPGGIAGEIHGESRRLVVHLADQGRAGPWLVEQAALDIRHAGFDFVLGPLINGQIDDETMDERRVAALRRTDTD